jgi:thiamine-phosphate pyrophosphorylase
MEDTCRLYLITPPRLDDLGGFADTLARALDAGDVACVQIRLKEASDSAVQQAVEALRPVIQERGAACLLNDRPDLAHATGCDGVHVGQEDAPYAQARRIMGPSAIVGVTCHDSRQLAMDAGEAGADYVAFGAFFPTTTKEPKSEADLDILDWWSTYTNVPCVAIGGITVQNCRDLVIAGADFLAVSNGVWSHAGGPAQAVKDFNQAMARAVAERKPRSAV